MTSTNKDPKEAERQEHMISETQQDVAPRPLPRRVRAKEAA